MPTLRGWALSGAGLALLVLWYALGEVELLLTGAFLLLAQAAALAPRAETTAKPGCQPKTGFIDCTRRGDHDSDAADREHLPTRCQPSQYRGRREPSRRGRLRGGAAQGKGNGHCHLSGHLSAARRIPGRAHDGAGERSARSGRDERAGPVRRTESWCTPRWRSSTAFRLSGDKIRQCRRPVPSTPDAAARTSTPCVSISKEMTCAGSTGRRRRGPMSS